MDPSYRIYFKFTKMGGGSGSTKNLRRLNYCEFGHPGSAVYRQQWGEVKTEMAALIGLNMVENLLMLIPLEYTGYF